MKRVIGIFLFIVSGYMADAGPGKKGACLITVREYADDWKERVASVNVDWHYSWGSERPKNMSRMVEFVPMVWGWGSDEKKNREKIESIIRQRKAGQATHLLGFNEPCSKTQSNIPVERAIAAWPELMKTGLRLGSPAPVQADGEWFTEFMKIAGEKKYRVDFICVHWYGGTNAKSLMKKLEQIHQLYQKPIWLTEFCPADWNAKKNGKNAHSPEQVRKFMIEVLPMLDELDYLERYAWFSSRENDLPLHTSALWKDDGTLTELGRIYAAHQSGK